MSLYTLKQFRKILLSISLTVVSLESPGAVTSCNSIFSTSSHLIAVNSSGALQEATKAGLNPAKKISLETVEKLGLALIDSDPSLSKNLEYNKRHDHDTDVARIQSKIPLLNGFKSFRIGLSTFYSNGKVAIEAQTWEHSYGLPLKKQLSFVDSNGEIQLANQSAVFAQALPDPVLLSRVMSSQEWQSWQQGDFESIHSTVHMFGRTSETEPTTTFALNPYMFSLKEPVLISVPRSLIQAMVEKGELEINTYGWTSEDTSEVMSSSNYSRLGLPVELKIFGNAARARFAPYFKNPIEKPQIFYPNSKSTVRFRWSNETLDQRLQIIMNAYLRDFFEGEYSGLVTSISLTKKPVQVNVKIDETQWRQLNQSQKLNAALIIHDVVLGHSNQLNGSRALNLLGKDGSLILSFDHQGNILESHF